MEHTPGNVVIEYHSHNGIRTAVDGETVLMVCDHVNLDGTPCGMRWDEKHIVHPGAGSHMSSAALIRKHITDNARA